MAAASGQSRGALVAVVVSSVEMKQSLRPLAITILVAAICGCASSPATRIAPTDRQSIRVIEFVEKQPAASPVIALRSEVLSRAFDGGLRGMGGEALLGAAFCPVVPCALGTAGLGALVGLIAGTYNGARCAAEVVDDAVKDPAAHVERMLEDSDRERFKRALIDRIQHLNAVIGPSSAGELPDTLLEIGEITILIANMPGKVFDSSSCPLGVSGRVTWRALRVSDHRLLRESTSQVSRKASSEALKTWLQDEHAVRADVGLLLDDLGAAIADDLLLEGTATSSGG